MRVKWPNEAHFIPYGSDNLGPWMGYQAWCADFDAILLNKAKSLGVKVCQPCHTINPIINCNRVTGVTTEEGEFRSTFLIDATGRNQWLATKLKLKVKKFSPNLIVRYGYMGGECPDRDNAPIIVADNNGWTWTAQVLPKVYHWTRLSFDNKPIKKHWIPKEFEGLKLLGNISGADMTWRIVIPSAGPGYFLVGDAAAVLDPASSHGVLKAIMSGIMAGHVIMNIIKNYQQESVLVNQYCEWLFNWFKKDIGTLKEMYKVFPEFQNHKM
ncbi:tryptophan 7-halogenase [Bacillus toyonensis]|uniref:NAD(P)/FAD-dependent oxidoreductase n=1 Tax=Bacillus toyonensis TaxID=155322 RepID=UPI001C3F12AB|nr:tryptophan 7-halogenase [Bacillus toyonensis]